jgi:hypothetical protein
MYSVRTSVCVLISTALGSVSEARPQYDLIPLHPVVGNIEAVGSGQYGRSFIRFGVPFPIPTTCGLAVGIGFTAGDGILELVCFRADGSQTGNPLPIRVIDLSVVGQNQGNGDFAGYVSQFGTGQVLQVNASPYIAAAPADTAIVQVRAKDSAVCVYQCNNAVCMPDWSVALNSATDGFAGSSDPSDLLDKRFQVIRDRGSLTSAKIFYDNTSWFAELRLEFALPAAGPALQEFACLTSPDRLWDGPQGQDPKLIANSNDTSAAELQPSDFELNPFTGTYLPLLPPDVSSFAIVPGTSTLSVYFDRKVSRLWNPGTPVDIRCAANSNVRDSFGNRVRSNAVPIQYVSCPSIPGPFQTLSPGPDSQGVPRTTALAWAESSCRASYTIKIATDPDLTNVVVTGGTSGTSYSLASTPLNLNTRYYWQVTATNVNGATTNLGGVQTFRTLIPGDLNADGVVNVVDLTQFLGNFGTSVP